LAIVRGLAPRISAICALLLPAATQAEHFALAVGERRERVVVRPAWAGATVAGRGECRARLRERVRLP
jgi:hypothetical protein